MENWGIYGVSTFFVISGYFLVDLRKDNNFNLLLYLKKKLFRLYPLYLVSLTLTALILLIVELPDKKITIGNYVLNALWINGFIDMPYIDGAHWYMTILISTILICGLFKKMNLSNNPNAYITVLVLNYVCLVLHIPILSILLGGGYIGIAFGGVALHKMEIDDTHRMKWLILMIVSCMFTWKIRGSETLIGLIMAMLLCRGAIRGFFGFLELKPFQYLGKISFELYLIHQNIAYAIEYKIQSITGSFNYLYSIIALASVLGISSCLYGVRIIISNKIKGIGKV